MVFQLIHKLDKSEKRYFILFSNHYKEGESHYLQLYNFVIENEVYDDAEIKEHFKEEDWIKNYTVVKRYLFERLMKVLRFYHEDQFDQSEFNQTLQNVQIFKWKGLEKSFIKEMKKLDKVAKKNENWDPYQAIYYRFVSQQSQLKGKADFSKKGVEERLLLLEDFETSISNLLDYVQLRKSSIKLRYGLFNEKSEIIEEVKKSSNFDESKESYDFTTKLLFFRNQYYYHSFYYNDEESLTIWKKMLDLFEEYPQQQKNHPSYFKFQSTYLRLLLSADDFQTFEQYLPKYKKEVQKIKKSSLRFQAEYEIRYLFLLKHLKEKQFEKALEVYKQGVEYFTKKEIQKYIPAVFVMDFYIMGCEAHLYLKQYQEIIAQYNFIDEVFEVDNLLSRAVNLHFFHLIALHEIKHKYFANELRKKIYFFKKNELYNKKVELFCGLFADLGRKITKAELLQKLKGHQATFELEHRSAMREYLDWINDKIIEVQDALKP